MTHHLYIEFKEESVHAVTGEHGFDLPLEREPSGRVTSASMNRMAEALRGFAQSHSRVGRTAYCSIPARGVSLRRLSIPANANGEAARLLPLQLEAQLPIAPTELAWGFESLGTSHSGSNGFLSEFLVAAVRKQFLEDYENVVRSAGLVPRFHIAALTRTALCQSPLLSGAMVEVESARAEVTIFDGRGAAAVRTLDPRDSSVPDLGAKIAFSSSHASGQKLASELAARWQRGSTSEIVPCPDGAGVTPANAGLRKLVESGRATLALDAQDAPVKAVRSGASSKWAIAAGLLLLLALAFRYAEASLYQGRISRQLRDVSEYRQKLPNLDRELSFLQFIKTNQPPYLDALAAVAAAAPSGTHVDTVSLIRRGELSLRGSVQDPQGPANFRAKLIESGFFTRVVIEDQTPVDNNQKMNFRLSAQVKPDGARPLPTASATNTSAASVPATNNSAK